MALGSVSSPAKAARAGSLATSSTWETRRRLTILRARSDSTDDTAGTSRVPGNRAVVTALAKSKSTRPGTSSITPA